MSVEAMSWALSDAPDVPPQCLAVLVGLANHAHANGRGAYPSQERLAHYARKSVRSVRRDLDELAQCGIIRRGDQRHTAFLPSDRRPVVWDLAIERHREVPAALDPLAEPRSGTTAEAVDNRADADVRSVADREDIGDQTAGRTRPSGRTHTSYKPSLNHQEPIRARAPQGAALPTTGARCRRHVGQPQATCAPCRSERIEATR